MPPTTPRPRRSNSAAPTILFAAAIVTALLLLPGFREGLMRSLVASHILVSSTEHPLWTLPGGVAGLDGDRAMLAAVIVVIVTAFVTSALRHRLRRVKIYRRLTSGDPF